jgi:hypothetical protein
MATVISTTLSAVITPRFVVRYVVFSFADQFFSHDLLQVGTLCNACQAGQVCGTGATTCLSGGQPPPPTPTTTRQTTTTKAEVPPPTTTTTDTSAPPTPTIVQTSGDFRYQGCYDDSTKRTLLVNSETDSSANGMTVRKMCHFCLFSWSSLRRCGIWIGVPRGKHHTHEREGVRRRL